MRSRAAEQDRAELKGDPRGRPFALRRAVERGSARFQLAAEPKGTGDDREPMAPGEAATAWLRAPLRPPRPARCCRCVASAKRFRQRPAVVDVSLDLAPAEVLGFVGPNGAGKTTTLRILAGLLRADAGEGHVLGHDIMAGGAAGRLVGYMPQRLALYGDLSVVENLRFRAEVYELPDPRRAVAAAIEDFELGAVPQPAGLQPVRRLGAAAAAGGRADPPADPGAAGRADRRAATRSRARTSGGASRRSPRAATASSSTPTTWPRPSSAARVALFSRGRVLALGDPHALAAAAPFERRADRRRRRRTASRICSRRCRA